MSRVLFIWVLWWCLPMAANADQRATEIARQVYFVNHFMALDNIHYGSKKQPMQLLNRPAKGKAQRYALERHLNNHYDKGEIQARDLAVFRSGKLRGTGILVDIYKDPQRPLGFSIWLPALRKVRRHSQPDQADIWGGSVFTYGDIYLRKPEDETHELLGEVTFPDCLGMIAQINTPRSCAPKGKTVLKLLSRNKRQGDWYDHRIVFVDPHSYADYRSVYYLGQEPVKVIDKDWRSMGMDDPRGQYWLYWYGRDLRSGAEGLAWVTPQQVKWNQPVKKSLWSLATLRRLSR